MMDARTLEEYTCRTWPALESVELDGWLLRFANGVTGRANAVYPLYPSQRDMSEKIAQVEQHYRSRGIRPAFKLVETQHRTLDAILDQRGYAFYNDSLVMAVKLGAELPAPPNEVVLESFNDSWMADYGRIHPERGTQTPTYRDLLTSPIGTRIYASIWADGQRAAVGVLSSSRAYGGIYCMATHPDYRERGMATRIVQAMLQHGKTHGLHYIFLQVAGDNAAAQHVYRRCGFERAYRYWYRVMRDE